MDYLAEIKQFHAQFIEPHCGKPVGCNEDEVAELESQIGFPLPEAYKQYLLWMGKDYNGIFRGSDWFMDNVVERTQWLPELLEENEVEFELPENYLVFFSHQGYLMAWFELPKESENPPSYFFGEVTQRMTQPRLEGTFTDVLFKDMQGMTRFVRTPR